MEELLARVAEIVAERDEALARLAERDEELRAYNEENDRLGVALEVAVEGGREVMTALMREIEALRRDARRFNAMMDALHRA